MATCRPGTTAPRGTGAAVDAAPRPLCHMTHRVRPMHIIAVSTPHVHETYPVSNAMPRIRSVAASSTVDCGRQNADGKEKRVKSMSPEDAIYPISWLRESVLERERACIDREKSSVKGDPASTLSYCWLFQSRWHFCMPHLSCNAFRHLDNVAEIRRRHFLHVFVVIVIRVLPAVAVRNVWFIGPGGRGGRAGAAACMRHRCYWWRGMLWCGRPL